MATAKAVRTHPRFNVCWSIIYRGEDFIGQGTIMDISHEGGRFAGTMPVEPGMRLRLYVDPPHKTEGLSIDEAVVTWVNGEQFGTQFTRIRPEDLHWLAGYLEVAERRTSFRQLLGLSPVVASEAAAVPLTLSVKG
jgi:hypothetical protein